MPIAAPAASPIPLHAAPFDPVVVDERPDLARIDLVEQAERLGSLPGLSMLETRRPGPAGRWSYLTAVGGGITWRSDAAAEWDEAVAKAGGPLRAIGAPGDAAAT